MKKLNLLSVVGVLLLCSALFVGCKTTAKLNVTFADLNGEWNVVNINGIAPTGENKPYIGIDSSTERLFGNAGCNRIMGQVDYPNTKKNNIRFINVATTRMACPDMSGEQTLVKLLNEVSRFEVQGTTLPVQKVVLFGMNGKPVITLERK
jgi:heat shock protein HslJ